MAWTRLILCQLSIVKNESFMFSTYSPSDPSPAFADLISFSPDLTSLEFGRRPHFMSHVYCVDKKANTRSLEAVEVFLITEILTLLWVFLVPSNAIAFLSDTEHRNTIFSEQSQRLITLEGKCFCHWLPENPSVEDYKEWLKILMTFRALALRQSYDEGLTLQRWQISVINSVDNTKLSWYTLPRTQHHSFFRKLLL